MEKVVLKNKKKWGVKNETGYCSRAVEMELNLLRLTKVNVQSEEESILIYTPWVLSLTHNHTTKPDWRICCHRTLTELRISAEYKTEKIYPSSAIKLIKLLVVMWLKLSTIHNCKKYKLKAVKSARAEDSGSDSHSK